jgi:hypothetical protein
VASNGKARVTDGFSQPGEVHHNLLHDMHQRIAGSDLQACFEHDGHPRSQSMAARVAMIDFMIGWPFAFRKAMVANSSVNLDGNNRTDDDRTAPPWDRAQVAHSIGGHFSHDPRAGGADPSATKLHLERAIREVSMLRWATIVVTAA